MQTYRSIFNHKQESFLTSPTIFPICNHCSSKAVSACFHRSVGKTTHSFVFLYSYLECTLYTLILRSCLKNVFKRIADLEFASTE